MRPIQFCQDLISENMQFNKNTYEIICIITLSVIYLSIGNNASIKNRTMENLEQTIIGKIRNLNFKVGIQDPTVIKKIYMNFSDEQIKNLKHFNNILGTCEKGWDVDQTIQNHLY